MNLENQDTLLLLLSATTFVIGAGGVYFWRKGDDKTDKIREQLIETASELNELGFSYSGGIATKLAAGNLVEAIALMKAAIKMLRDPVKRLAHFGDIAVQNIATLLDDPKFGPQIRKAVKDQDILIASPDSTTSSPV